MKPELLLPAGKVDAFYAALEGGADAIYLGLDDFNARKRARNFTIQQLPVLIQLAHKKHTKIFVTLNTVIKNDELARLYILLEQLSQTNIDAIIIQDWGVFFLAKKYFPNLEIHASTQMAFHNSVGANFAQRVGFQRVILARELTKNELTGIRKKTKIELELFVHGALCYSFSGLCLFSSYLGGMSANRGACKQPCRRLFTDNNQKHYIFSLKDNELIDYVPELIKLGINSLKIEGRMKSADYVYTIARAYRMVIDNPDSLPEAKELLKLDIGREKTSYFFGGNVSDAITEMPNTGLYAGKIESVSNAGILFSSNIPYNNIGRIRVCSPNGNKQINLKVHEIKKLGKLIEAQVDTKGIKKQDLVFVIGFLDKKFASRLPSNKGKTLKPVNFNEALNKTRNLVKPVNQQRVRLFLRIDTLAWLKNIRLEDVDFLILSLPIKEWGNIPESNFIASDHQKIIIEFPKFIKEENSGNYKKFARQLKAIGINKFMLSHLSQIDLVPDKCEVYTNENVYVFNNAAIAQLKHFRVTSHVYPLETDIKNLTAGKDRSGILPVYFSPQLFYSRMPVKTENHQGEFSDDARVDYKVIKRGGMTVTLPQKPVAIFQNKKELIQKGFKQFLIDVSFIKPSQNTFKMLIKKYNKGEQVQPSTSFNFKKGLS